ncbi:MAG: hypothetical protein NVS1B4_00500 [Gemmatimonadaceae bacterium]
MMNRRRLVAVVSATSLLSILALVAIAVGIATRSAFGRDQLRGIVTARLAGALAGKAYLGHFTQLGLGEVEIDSLELRDRDDSLFVASGPITVLYDPRDLMNARIRIRSLVSEHPVVNIRRYENDDWNFRHVFKRGPSGPDRPGTGFGEYVVLDSTVIHSGRLSLTLPWHPDDSLRGARRDSAVRAALSLTDKHIRISREGRHIVFARTWRWTGIDGYSPHLRLALPDSAGRRFAIGDLKFDESDPPFAFRNITGSARWLGDSIWLDARHWDLPGSTGSAQGKIWWGDDLPVRYSVRVTGDSISLADVAWVYPTLPRTGGGRMELEIRNAPRNLDVIDYAIRRMDVRTARSHLTGDMTYGVGGPVLVVKDVNLTAAPVDFALLRTLNGRPFPVDWQGELSGAVRARGGPLNRFMLDEARATFADAHVPGAVTRFSATGGLDILEPSLTKFRGLAVNVSSIDLRSLEFLYPNFPRLTGTVSGTAMLDSSWLDVRISNADLTHRDGAVLPSHVTGSGRVTWGPRFLVYDLDLDAHPLSTTMLARSYPGLPFRGPFAGPIRVVGTLPDLEVTTALSSGAGKFTFDGRIGADQPAYSAKGAGTLTTVDLHSLLDTTTVPPTDLSGSYRIDVHGRTIADLVGSLDIALSRSRVGTLRVLPSMARLRFGNGVMNADSISIATAGGRLTATGGIGLARGRSDTVHFRMEGDSLSALRDLIAGDTARTDSVGGRYSVQGDVVGSLDSLSRVDVRATLDGHALVLGGFRAQNARGEVALTDALRARKGVVRLALDSTIAWGARVTSLTGSARFFDATRARVRLSAVSATGPTLVATADVRREARTVIAVVDTADLAIEDRKWTLRRPSRIVTGAAGASLDSLVLASGRWGRVVASGDLPFASPVRVTVIADSVPLRDIGLLIQTRDTLGGRGSFRGNVSGVRAGPIMTMSAAVADATWGGSRTSQSTVEARYAERRLDVSAALYREGRPAVRGTATLPIDLAMLPVRSRLLPDSLRGSVRTDSVDLSVFETFSSRLERARGRLNANLTLAGTWEAPAVSGTIGLVDGMVFVPQAGVRLEGIEADLQAVRNVLRIRTLRGRSGAQVGNYATLSGAVDFSTPSNPIFDLRFNARDFRIISDRRTAELDLTANAALAGPYKTATVSGVVTFPRGSVYVPEFTRRRIIDDSDPDFREILDTSDVASRELLPAASSEFVQNLLLSGLTIELGQDVWLRSPDANIQLGGTIGLTTDSTDVHGRRAGSSQYKLALNGALSADRGTYRLNLGLVARTFQVERGSIRFNGTADLNPDLDIRALYTARQQQSEERDVRIRVEITGTLATPQLSLASADGLQYSQADLFSYLLTGRRNLFATALEGNPATTTGISVLLPTATTIVEQALQSQFGRGVDFLSVQTGGYASATGAGDIVDKGVTNTRIGVGKQITDRTYATLSAGVCPLTRLQTNENAVADFRDALGIRVEHRLNFGFSLEASVEPATTLRDCYGTGPQTTRIFTSVPKQYGFDLFRSWSF